MNIIAFLLIILLDYFHDTMFLLPIWFEFYSCPDIWNGLLGDKQTSKCGGIRCRINLHINSSKNLSIFILLIMILWRNSYNICDDCRMMKLEKNEWKKVQKGCKMEKPKKTLWKDEENEDFAFQKSCTVVHYSLGTVHDCSCDTVHGNIIHHRNVARSCTISRYCSR